MGDKYPEYYPAKSSPHGKYIQRKDVGYNRPIQDGQSYMDGYGPKKIDPNQVDKKYSFLEVTIKPKSRQGQMVKKSTVNSTKYKSSKSGSKIYKQKGAMITDANISYKYIDFAGMSISQIQRETYGSILIWITGSAYYDQVTPSKYECLMEYKGHTKYICNSLNRQTANRVMIEGIIAAVECVNRPSNIVIISANSLGIRRAFNGTGPNANRLQDLYKIMVEKNCSLTEGRYTNGAEIIKKYIGNCSKE